MAHHSIEFVKLDIIQPSEITAHMSDPRMAEHMPLLACEWDERKTAAFLAAKAECWRHDGLGHWAILVDGSYAGWGGFQKEGDEWDFGLVLRPEFFGSGISIAATALEYAMNDPAIPYVTFLLPMSRKHLGALKRAGAIELPITEYGGIKFRKFRLDTTVDERNKKGQPVRTALFGFQA